MDRLTERTQNGATLKNGISIQQAANKLAKLEDFLQELEDEQQALSFQLDQLRRQGKTNSAQFRERMGRKLVNSSILSRLQVLELL